MPLAMATTQLRVAPRPKTSLRSRPLPDRPRAWYSAIIQASKTLKSSVVATPPHSRPANSTHRLSLSIVRHVSA